MSQGMRAASAEAGKAQETAARLHLPEGIQTSDTLILAQ